MRTPGADQALIYGFLLTEQLIEDLDDVGGLVACESYPQQRLHLTLESGVRLPERSRRSFISSSCGLCSLEQLDFGVDAPSLTDHPHWIKRELRQEQISDYYRTFNASPSLFSLTGGAHIAALFSPSGDVRYTQADVGRHNAIDKVIGAAALQGDQALWGWVLMVSSRAGFEVIVKAAAAGVGALITLGAASGAAHRYSLASGLPLYSFTRLHRSHRHLSQ
jgi:FdhD protein